ncbi:hypothetical protein Mal4_51600 [Maioricimonas rarisocia]|uniref:DUF4760 domain-containing protein n=1 Tax=Maioricimonas rarisocia TaxID=2528026 RepID=A0A517ZEC8_9PLAN|nr:hypothetical protein [Maioricimonas rarisocia]QDU40800.1 hypothetical protein Mal4_51600 [Maioricimonas rarisocia]
MTFSFTSDELIQFQAWTSFAQAILVLVTTIAILWIHGVISSASERLTKLQLLRANYDAWKDIDTFFLTNPELLPVLNQFTPDAATDEPEEAQKKRLVAFLMLNPLYSYFYALDKGYVSPRMREQFNHCLKPLVRDPTVLAMIKSQVFVEGFAEYCEKLSNS